MSVVIRVIYEGTTYDLDIQEDIPLRLDISAIENSEIGEFFGVGSQTFDLPGTKNNNRFFKHAYNIGGEDIPAFYNTIDGKIISKGETLLKGQFQLLETIKDEDGFVVYKCQVTDETVQFKDNIQNKLIKNADWSDYTHTLNVGAITGSWTGGLLGGKVYYPLADYGYNDPESQGNFPQFAFGEPDNGNIVGNFINNSLTPVQPIQFLPSVRAKDTLEIICAQAGFSASGDFINSGNFSNLYLLPKAKEDIGVVVSGSEQATGYAWNDYNQSIPPNSNNVELAANTIVVDPLNKFTVSGSQGYVYYNADGIGEYQASTQVQFFNPCSFSNAVVEVEIQLIRGSFPFSGTVIASDSVELSSIDGFNSFTLSAGGSFNSTTDEDVWTWVRYTHVSGNTPPNLNLFGFATRLRIDSAPEVYNNATVNMALQWPADLKSIDIVKGIIQQFNLVVYPHPTQSKTIVFEQFDDWIREGETKDWTEKWDTATRVAVKHTIDEEPQELILGNEDDADRFSVEAKESDPFFQYGTLRILADNNISQGSKTVKNAFAPTVLGGPFVSGSVTQDGNPTYNIDLGSSFAYPHLYKFENNQLKSYKFRTRIGYKSNNSFPSGSDKYRMAIGTGPGDTTIVTGSYGTLSNVNGLPAQPGASDLHFNNTYFKFAGPGLNLGNTTSNFDTYWKTYIDSLYWDENRKVTLDIQFNSDEYKNIKLNDIIFVKDQQYRINKISGFNVTQDDVATVELIRLYPQYYSNNANCDFNFTIEPLDCDFTFEAIPGATPPPPTPTPTPAVCKKTTITCVSSNGCTGLAYVDCSGNNQSTGYLPFNQSTQVCAFSTSNVPGDGYIVTAVIDPACQSPTPTPTPTPTLPPGPTPTPTPGGQTPTPTPTPAPQVFSYTGFAGYSNYLDACSGSAATIYTRGEIGTGSIAYEDAQLTNVFDFNRFFIDENTGIGYEFVDPNTTGQVIDTQNDACNVEVFNLYISFNEYDACTETVTDTLYAPAGTTLQNGTILYTDINLQLAWWGQTRYEIKFIESGSDPKQIYYNTETGVSQSGTDECYTVFSFDGWDSTATTPPSAVCGDTDETFYSQGIPSIGDNIFTDAALTDPIFTGEKFVYNDDANLLYAMSGSTGGNGFGWVIGSITSSYCSPATPTPSPTPAPIVTQMSVSASWSSYNDACTNPGFTGTLYLTSLWQNGEYVDYFYEDNTQTNIFDFYQWVVNTDTGDGYQLSDPNTTGRVISTGSDVCNPGIFSLGIDFNEYEACTGCVTTTKYSNESVFATGIDLYTDIELEYDWTEGIGTDFKISGSDTIYRYTGAERFGGSGVIDTGNTCYSIYEFIGRDYNHDPGTIYCGGTYTSDFFTKGTPEAGVGMQVYNDSCLTDTISTARSYVYNSETQDLYVMGAGPDPQNLHSIVQIISDYCLPPTPTPSPTPAPIVTALGAVTGSSENEGFTAICDNDPYAGLVTGSGWLKAVWNPAGTPGYDYYMYRDEQLTQLWTQVSWMVDSNNDGYYFARENLTGQVWEFYDSPVCKSGSAIDVQVKWNSTFDQFCSGSGHYDKTLYISESRNYLVDGDYLFENESCTELYGGFGAPYIREYSSGIVWESNVDRQWFTSSLQCDVPIIPQPTVTPPPTATPTPTPTPSPTPSPVAQWNIIYTENCTTTVGKYFNWYGVVSDFPGPVVYDSQNGCLQAYWQGAGYNANYEILDCSTRYDYFNNCSDCINNINQRPCVTPAPTPTPTPGPNRWITLYAELCTQPSNSTNYNWYGDPNNFPAQYVYDQNTGWCNDILSYVEGYNANYDTIDCSSRFKYYDTCPDCTNNINEVACYGPTPPTPTPVPATPAPTIPPNTGVYRVKECYTSPTFFFQYDGGTIPSNYFKVGATCYEVVEQMDNAYWNPNLTMMGQFYNSCGDCFGPATPIPSSTPTPTPVPATPTPVPTSTPSYKSYGLYECGTTTAYYFKYDVGTNGDLVANDVLVYGTKCYRVIVEVDYFETDPEISGFVYDSCTDCQLFGL